MYFFSVFVYFIISVLSPAQANSSANLMLVVKLKLLGTGSFPQSNVKAYVGFIK